MRNEIRIVGYFHLYLVIDKALKRKWIIVQASKILVMRIHQFEIMKGTPWQQAIGFTSPLM